jgi:hypothetical protein
VKGGISDRGQEQYRASRAASPENSFPGYGDKGLCGDRCDYSAAPESQRDFFFYSGGIHSGAMLSARQAQNRHQSGIRPLAL